MLNLDSYRWLELEHAYGKASDIPALLKSLKSMPSSSGDSEPWFSIWSSLAHQGDVYSASFAAVPHVVAAIESEPDKADFSYFQFPAWVEICRVKGSVTIPEDLAFAYFDSLKKLPSLVAKVSSIKVLDPVLLSCALAAIAASNGQIGITEAILELNPQVANEFLDWLFTQ